MKPKIHLVTRADDAGSYRSANEAIFRALESRLENATGDRYICVTHSGKSRWT